MGGKLSEIMKGSLVIAPNANVDANGNAVSGAGKWNIFVNGKLVDSFDATQEKYAEMLKQINEDPSKFIEQYEK